jgi:pimeloyl-ACP methyl ester carboxylesterase
MLLRIDDADLDTLDEGSGPPLVLLHGFPLNKETWDLQAERLRSRARVIRFDLRGLGKSSVTPGPYLMTQLAGDVAGVLDALHVERATIVGHSLGTYVAFAFFRMFSERVAGLGLLCGTARADTDERRVWRLGLAERVEREGAAVLADAYVPRYFAPLVYQERPELAQRAEEIVLATKPAGAAAMLRGMADRDKAFDLFEDFEIPISVVGGKLDAFNPPEESELIAQCSKNATLDLFDCGHFPQWEVPDATCGLIETLMKRVKA